METDRPTDPLGRFVWSGGSWVTPEEVDLSPVTIAVTPQPPDPDEELYAKERAAGIEMPPLPPRD